MHGHTVRRRAATKEVPIRRGCSAFRRACCLRPPAQQASAGERHGQLSRESEIFVIVRVYFFAQVINEANQASSACRLCLEQSVETSTPPKNREASNVVQECLFATGFCSLSPVLRWERLRIEDREYPATFPFHAKDSPPAVRDCSPLCQRLCGEEAVHFTNLHR